MPILYTAIVYPEIIIYAGGSKCYDTAEQKYCPDRTVSVELAKIDS
jgi:hypothetical protein